MVQKGDPLLPQLTAEFFNNTIRRNRAYSIGGNSVVEEFDNVKIRVQNATGSALNRFDPVLINGFTFIDYDITQHTLAYYAAAALLPLTPTSADQNNWGVVQEPLGPLEIGWAVFAGFTFLNIPDYTSVPFVPNSRFWSLGSNRKLIPSASEGKGIQIGSGDTWSSNTKLVVAVQLSCITSASNSIHVGYTTSVLPKATTSGSTRTLYRGTAYRQKQDTYDTGTGTMTINDSATTDFVYNTSDDKDIPMNTLITYQMSSLGIYIANTDARNVIISS